MFWDIRKAREKDYQELIELWEASVRVTHDFLAERDLLFYKKRLPEYFDQAFLLALQEDKRIIHGFVGTIDDSIAMLFVHPERMGMGIGTLLLGVAMLELGARKVDVNEQNLRAKKFYEKYGFRVEGRSPVDDEGLPYPLLHMVYQRKRKKR
ncbi:MAG: GNAT family N-acetyltransferase [Deltaproteobacteria bacterium]|jgi:putative acetyltransferase|nr:GNAT family N-acetyltransferase [Deltaproteobacteria bacterium]